MCVVRCKQFPEMYPAYVIQIFHCFSGKITIYQYNLFAFVLPENYTDYGRVTKLQIIWDIQSKCKQNKRRVDIWFNRRMTQNSLHIYFVLLCRKKNHPALIAKVAQSDIVITTSSGESNLFIAIAMSVYTGLPKLDCQTYYVKKLHLYM